MSELPEELEARIQAFEQAAPGPVFDRMSWLWMFFWGAVLPLLLILAGWWA